MPLIDAEQAAMREPWKPGRGQGTTIRAATPNRPRAVKTVLPDGSMIFALPDDSMGFVLPSEEPMYYDRKGRFVPGTAPPPYMTPVGRFLLDQGYRVRAKWRALLKWARPFAAPRLED